MYKGFSYESKETVAKIGPIEATAETTKNVPIPEVLSIVAIAPFFIYMPDIYHTYNLSALLAKYLATPSVEAFMPGLPLFQPAGQTSPCSSKN